MYMKRLSVWRVCVGLWWVWLVAAGRLQAAVPVRVVSPDSVLPVSSLTEASPAAVLPAKPEKPQVQPGADRPVQRQAVRYPQRRDRQGSGGTQALAAVWLVLTGLVGVLGSVAVSLANPGVFMVALVLLGLWVIVSGVLIGLSCRPGESAVAVAHVFVQLAGILAQNPPQRRSGHAPKPRGAYEPRGSSHRPGGYSRTR
jgi:hypothetical protein